MHARVVRIVGSSTELLEGGGGGQLAGIRVLHLAGSENQAEGSLRVCNRSF